MNRRILLLILLLAVLGLGAFLLLPTLTGGPIGGPQGTAVAQSTVGPTATPIELVPIVVAVQQLPRGIAIPEGALSIRSWPRNSVPERAIGKIEDVVGKIARTDIFIEQPILDTLLVENLSQIAAKGSDAAAITPRGRVLISIPVDRLTDVAYAVQPGDYVDIIVSFLFVDVDPNFQTIKPNTLTFITVSEEGAISLSSAVQGELQPSNFSQFPVVVGPNEQQRPRLVTQRTIQAAWVAYVGNFPLDGNILSPVSTPLPTPTPEDTQGTKTAPKATATPAFPDIVTIAVEPQEAVALAWMIESRIPITLVLRSAQGDPSIKTDPTSSVSLQYMIETYNITQPPALPYALEPALRSIRSLFAGSTISLGSGNAEATPTP
jgi:Flp pilus assembly protein CpaB